LKEIGIFFLRFLLIETAAARKSHNFSAGKEVFRGTEELRRKQSQLLTGWENWREIHKKCLAKKICFSPFKFA
jgi:hypothetical protein